MKQKTAPTTVLESADFLWYFTDYQPSQTKMDVPITITVKGINDMKPKRVTPAAAEKIIETRQPIGLFYVKQNALYTGIDNRTGDAWTEDFSDQKSCFDWLAKQ